MVEHLNHFSPKEDLNGNHETVLEREVNFVTALFSIITRTKKYSLTKWTLLVEETGS